MDYLTSLKATIKKLHGCDSTWIGSASVKALRGKDIWNGEIERFQLKNHPKAKWCYAWSYKMHMEQNPIRYLTVLELTPVNSAQTAVEATIKKSKQKAIKSN